MHPEAPKIHIINFDNPPDKSTVKRTTLTNDSLFGIRTNFSWTFTVNDNRAWERKSWKGRGIHANSITAVTARCHGMTGFKSCVAHTCRPTIDNEAGLEAEPEVVPEHVAELGIETKLFKGWKTSYAKNDETKVLRQRRVLAGQLAARPERAVDLPESSSVRSMAAEAESATKARQKRLLRKREVAAFNKAFKQGA